MRAYNNNTTTPLKTRKTSWPRALTIVFAICALAVPATASANTGPVQGPSPDRVLGYGGTAYSDGAGSSGSSAGPVALQPVPGDGFDWLSAAIGCGAALVVSAMAGTALLGARRRRIGLPPGASMG